MKGRAEKWERMSYTKEERVDERLIEKIDISFSLTIDVHMILLRQKWMIGNSKVWVWSRYQLTEEEEEEEERDKMPPFRWRCFLLDIVSKEMVTYLRNSGGKRLAISMVEEAWLGEKEEV
ncbi:hypothetical protein Tco_1073065 [Tanacetum coccineum]